MRSGTHAWPPEPPRVTFQRFGRVIIPARRRQCGLHVRSALLLHAFGSTEMIRGRWTSAPLTADIVDGRDALIARTRTAVETPGTASREQRLGCAPRPGVPAGRHPRSCCRRASPSQGRPAAHVQATGSGRPRTGGRTRSSPAGPIARVDLGYCLPAGSGSRHHHDTGRPRTGPPAAVCVGYPRRGRGSGDDDWAAPFVLNQDPLGGRVLGMATLAGMVSSPSGTCRLCESW
jgi:hypothetical protein